MSELTTSHSSLVGGSTASRRLNCPASWGLEQKAPRSKSSAAARQGTALHEMIALILDEDRDLDGMLPFAYHQEAKHDQNGNQIEERWDYTVTEDEWSDLGEPALGMFEDFLIWLEHDQEDAPASFMVEESGEFPGIPGAFGTSDVPFRCGEIGGIWDWKFGKTPVSAEDNEQLMFYFASTRNKFPKFFEGVKRVVLCISQPQQNDQEPDIWETTPEDIDLFIADLQDAIKEAQEPEPHIEKGPWCKFADCKAVCPLHIRSASKLGEKLGAIESAKKSSSAPEDAMAGVDFDAFLSEAMELAEDAKEWAKHIARVTQERLEAGGAVTGWKVVKKESSGREWTASDDKVISRLRSRGLKADQYYKKTLVTPPAAEKVLKKMGKELPEDIVRKKPSSGYTLTREGDARPSADPASKGRRLGQALLKMTEGS